jgi:hypothetical protein
MPANWGSGQVVNWSAFEMLIADSMMAASSGTGHPGVGLMDLDGRTQSHATTIIINGMPAAGPGSD